MKLSGNKTYLTGLGLILAGITNAIQTADFANLDWDKIGMGLGFIFLRQGVSKSGPASPSKDTPIAGDSA